MPMNLLPKRQRLQVDQASAEEVAKNELVRLINFVLMNNASIREAAFAAFAFYFRGRICHSY
jgi:hypothetical protein